jgi:hypothetical protein
MFTEVILARGHENILSTNRTTLEITKEEHLSKKGDCIIAVAADKAIADLSSDFKESLCRENGRLIILIEVDGTSETINAFGDPFLILTHHTDIVVRKSRYISDRTLAIQADKAACDLSRRLVEKLQNPEQKVKITLSAEI